MSTTLPRLPPPGQSRPGGGGLLSLVEGGRLPLAFIGQGLAAFAVGSVWLVAEAGWGWPPYFHVRFVALVHLWLPGFLLSISIGATYQLMPVVVGSPLRARSGWLWSHWVLHAFGVVALVAGLALGRYAVAAAGGLAMGAGVIGLLVVTLRTFLASRRRDAIAWSFPLAAGWLVATVLAGLVLAINRRHPFIPLPALNLLHAHAHLGLIGYFVTLLQGVTFQLLPMFTMATVRRPHGVWLGLVGTQAGLFLLAPSLAWGWTEARGVAVALLVAGLGESALAFTATLRARRTRKLDSGLTAFVAGTVCLLFAAVVAVWRIREAAGTEHALAEASIYGLLLIVGGLALPVLGMGCKILPFLIWMKVYGPRLGREDVPLAKALGSPALERAWLGLHLTGLVILVLGLGMTWSVVAFAGGMALALGAACYLAQAACVARHLGNRSRPEHRPVAPAFSRTESSPP